MLYLVTGPPAAGKSTWVRERAKHGDITIDFDALAGSLTPKGDQAHLYPEHVRTVTKAARKAAVDSAVQFARAVNVYVIHSTPTPGQVRHLERLGAETVTIDPGQDIVLERCRRERPAHMLEVARQWYEEQSYIPI
jgi:hypothetical protein